MAKNENVLMPMLFVPPLLISMESMFSVYMEGLKMGHFVPRIFISREMNVNIDESRHWSGKVIVRERFYLHGGVDG